MAFDGGYIVMAIRARVFWFNFKHEYQTRQFCIVKGKFSLDVQKTGITHIKVPHVLVSILSNRP